MADLYEMLGRQPRGGNPERLNVILRRLLPKLMRHQELEDRLSSKRIQAADRHTEPQLTLNFGH